MKGIVFTEFLEMIESRHSPDWVDDLVESAETTTGGVFTAVGTYPHTDMVALVVRHAEMAGTPVPEVLREFGRYLFGRFAVLYPVFFDGVPGPLEFLERIESVIHVEVRKLYPDAELPRFDAMRDADGALFLIYRSERHLADLAAGLIEGCLAHYQGSHRFERLPNRPDGSVPFHISPNP